MTIELLTQIEFDRLLSIQKKFPRLTFQNEGFQYINRNEFSPDEKLADLSVKEILKNHIKGFIEFNNFLFDKNGQLKVRFQYKWSPSFTGVGYITVRELLNGFDEK